MALHKKYGSLRLPVIVTYAAILSITKQQIGVFMLKLET